jgi:hypothetical protein
MNLESGAFSLLAPHVDPTPMLADETVADTQPQSDAFHLFLGSEKRLEDSVQILR